jgi:hypothetical protein
VTAQHLALGVIHTVPQATIDMLVPDPGRLSILRQALGGTDSPAPVTPEDIGYQDAARDALDGATRIAAEAPDGPATHPLHILLGIFRPWNTAGGQASEPSEVALVLAAIGLNDARLQAVFPKAFAAGHR